MNLYIFNFKLSKNSIIRSLLITFCLLSIYHVLVLSKIVKPVNGTHSGQSNFIRVQEYAYLGYPKSNIVLVGSSLTANIPTSYINSNVTNLGMSGGCSQTGIEVVRRKSLKPQLLLIEVNDTIRKKLDIEIIDSVYNPFLYYPRLYFPMLRQEYQPFNVLLLTAVALKHKLLNENKVFNKERNDSFGLYINSDLRNKLVARAVEANKNPLSKKEESVLRQEAEYLRAQILQLRQDGVRVILFDVPGEQQVQTTVKGKQIQTLMRELFPSNKFDWLPEPPPINWTTLDGIHLVASDAKDYALFLRNQLLSKTIVISKPAKALSTSTFH